MEVMADPNDFCGISWADAYNNCPMPCPSGNDSDCASLGDGYTCHSFTQCLERIQSGEVIPGDVNPSPATTNDENSVMADPNDFCGMSWADAYNNCPMPCPSGNDSDCASLGDGYTCHSFTQCLERIQSGEINPGGDVPSPGLNPTAQPVAISFPDCPALYSPEDSNTYGTMVAYAPPGRDSTETQMVYSCQGQPDCSAGPPGIYAGWASIGTCPVSDAETQPLPARWWLGGGADVECLYGNDYPNIYVTDPAFSEYFFDSREDCCDMHPDACGVENGMTTTTLMPGSSSPAPSMPLPKSPTQEPTSADTTFTPTMMPTSGSSALFAHSSFVFCVASIFVAFLI